jgi:hypothetical protein
MNKPRASQPHRRSQSAATSDAFATNQPMKLINWDLTEGRIPGMHVTRNPSIADVIAVIEAIHVDLKDPFVILGAPEIEGLCAGYCQTLASQESSYRSEIRLFGGNYNEYRHYNLMRPDEQGRIGTPEPGRPGWIAGYDPDLATVIEVFTQFASKPDALPEIPGWQWLDITEEIDADT